MPSARTKALAAVAASACLTVLTLAPTSAMAAEGECPNEALRVGFSAHLPECRAYEVVTPDAGALPMNPGIGTHGVSNNMDTWYASPDGESVIFDTAGAIRDENANGTTDRYESRRTSQGWVMKVQGPTGAEATSAFVGGASPDHRYSFYKIREQDGGSLAPGNYVRERGGSYQPIGIGSLGQDPNARALWITEGGSHLIFETTPPWELVRTLHSLPPTPLQPDAPQAPLGAIYDRSIGGPTHVISLLPEDAIPGAESHYLGSSTDGAAVVFEINGTMYVRRDDSSTDAVAFPRRGKDLFCRVTNLNPATYSTQWLRNGQSIAGATHAEYSLQPADANSAIQCRVEGAGASSVSRPFSNATDEPIALPTISGPLPSPIPAAPDAGTIESCPEGNWSGSPSFAYQWFKNGSAIPAATSKTYEVKAADVPAVLQCSVTASNAEGTVVAYSDGTATNPAPIEPEPIPTVEEPNLIRTLTCTAPNLGEFGYSWQWLRDGDPIPGATGGEYRLRPVDEGKIIQCQIKNSGAIATSVPPTLVTTADSPIAPSTPRAPLSSPIPAAPDAGTIESCPEGNWSGSPSFAYQWFKNGSAIPAATSKTYEVKAADVPAVLQCSVTASNAEGTVVAYSAATATNPPPSEVSSAPIVEVNGGLEFTGKKLLTFAGASPNGASVFYLRGKLESKLASGYEEFDVFNTASASTTTIANEGEIRVIQVAEDGSHAYFLTTAVLSGDEANSVGAKAAVGKQNLYAWDGSSIHYITTIPAADLQYFSPPREAGGEAIDQGAIGLGFYPATLGSADAGPESEPARTTPTGSVLVFQSSGNLIPSYDSQGHQEIYRYDTRTDELGCISCNPEGLPATADAELETTSANVSERRPGSEWAHISNVTPDGEVVVFNTAERLLPEDEDDFYDVYRWREGELALISGGQSTEDSFLAGMSRDGRDIFFHTYDTLAPQDQDGGTRTIYDARVDGGFFPPPKGAVCEGEGCQGGLPSAPVLPGASTPTFHGPGNLSVKKKHKHAKKKHRKKKRHQGKARKGVGR